MSWTDDDDARGDREHDQAVEDAIANFANYKPEPMKRSTWGTGPWDEEPDRVALTASGYQCLLRRLLSGAWAGYVDVGPSHPWASRQWAAVDVHGGISWSHGRLPMRDEPEHRAFRAEFWVGFDCCHFGDLSPCWPRYGDEYRDLAYAKAQVQRLAQLAREAEKQ